MILNQVHFFQLETLRTIILLYIMQCGLEISRSQKCLLFGYFMNITFEKEGRKRIEIYKATYYQWGIYP